MKKGFTLVELSIVLVIVGLLIGGILIGKSLIQSAEINRFVSELKQYEIATIQFHKKFKKYPGDSQYFTPPGNGNNILGYGANAGNQCAAAPNASLRNYEPYQFWAHLSQAKMLSETYVPFSPQGVCAGGVHTDEMEVYDKVNGPYILYEPIAVNELGYAGVGIIPTKYNSSDNLYFDLYPKPWMVNALENKVGSSALTNFGNQVGLFNFVGFGNCTSTSFSAVSCSDPTAMLGHFAYFIPPQ